MADNTGCLAMTRGWAQRSLVKSGLAFAVAVLLLLAASARAQAECTDESHCANVALFQQAIATQNFNVGVFYQAAADQEAARQNWQASSLYREAANNKLNEAQIWSIAAENSILRGRFLSAAAGDELHPGGAVAAGGQSYSRRCVPRKAQHPLVRKWGLCMRRLIVTVRNRAQLAGAAAVAYGYCLRRHQEVSSSKNNFFINSAVAAKWCADWRWFWIVY